MADETDAALVRAAGAGDATAFNRLVDAHQQAVRAFLRRVALDPHEADDLAQETFLTAWGRLQAWRGQSSLRTWLIGIAWRKANGARRSLFRSLARDTGYAERVALERPEQARGEDRLALANAMAALPVDQRAVIALCLAQDFSHSEAADILRLPLGTVKSHATRGRAKLLSVLGGQP